MKRKDILQNAKQIFKQGSITYFNSAQLFPLEIRYDVFILYSFVRTADDYIDQKNPQTKKFYLFKQQFLERLNGKHQHDLLIDPFFELMQKRNIEPEVPLKFLSAMEQDLTKTTYKNLTDLKEYMEGSAEVVGLMMAKIMQLDPKSYPYAKLLGRAMQFINFIRDINHDLSMNRTYIPQKILKKHNLNSVGYEITSKDKEQFVQMIKSLINHYLIWQQQAEKGYKFIPKECLVPIKTAADMYKWTANEIIKDPFIIYRKRLKPTRSEILRTLKQNQQQL